MIAFAPIGCYTNIVETVLGMLCSMQRDNER